MQRVFKERKARRPLRRRELAAPAGGEPQELTQQTLADADETLAAIDAVLED